MNTFLQITPEDYGQVIIRTKGFMETLGFGAQMLLLGIGTVFAVLFLIWGALSLFKVFFHDLPAKKAAKRDAEPVESTEVSDAPVGESNDEEIVAVIAAAIAMAESDADGAKYKVVSFKRK